MPERDTDLFQISIRQIGEHREINVVLGKALSVLPDTELLEPVRNLLHRGRTPRVSGSMVRSRNGTAKQQAPDEP